MKLEAHYFVETLVNCLLPRFSPDNEFLHINLEADYRIGRTRKFRDVHLLFHRPHNYTKVFWHVAEKHVYLRDIPFDGWELKCDHDSCWASDGLSSPFFSLHMSLLGKKKEQDYHIFAHPGLSPVSRVVGRLERISDDYPRKYNVHVESETQIDQWARENNRLAANSGVVRA